MTPPVVISGPLCVTPPLSRTPFRTWKTYSVTKGPQFALERKRQATDLTTEMLTKWVAG